MPKHMLRPEGEFPVAGLGRRMAAIFYDSILCIAIALVIGLIYKGVQIGIYGFDQFKALSDSNSFSRATLYSCVLFAEFAFFAKFWMHSGQTLGMQVWRIRVQNNDGSSINLWQALLRFITALASWLCLGLGFWWALWDKQKRTWHDQYSESVIVSLPKK